MKKIISIILCLLMVCAAFCGCSAGVSQDNAEERGELRVVTTIFPLYDWAKNLTDGTGAELTMLLDTGVDLHSFQPTVKDIVTISDCDIFIYVGGESDEWVEDALREKTNEDMTVINLMDSLEDVIKEEEVVEGMEEEEDEDEDGEEGPEYDEHIWLSLRNAQQACRVISDALSEKDSQNAEKYQENTQAYLEKLSALDEAYTAAVEAGTQKTLLFGDRFPFRYLTDDYGLSYYAAFVGCSAESEASFETVMFLANKIDELGLGTILKIESSDGSIAETIKENTVGRDQQILTLDSLQSVKKEDVDAGETYLQIMTENLETLKEALK